MEVDKKPVDENLSSTQSTGVNCTTEEGSEKTVKVGILKPLKFNDFN